MTATAPAALVIALAGAFLLLWSAAGHLRGFDLLRATVVGHDILPYRWHRQVALALVAAEVTIGGAVIVSWLLSRVPLTLGLAAQAVLYASFCGYATLVLRSGRSVACGCFGAGESITWAVPLRAAVVAVAATVAAVAVPPGPTPAVTAALALGAAVLLRHLPRLARTPERTHAT